MKRGIERVEYRDGYARPNHLNFSERDIERMEYRDGYARPNDVNSLVHSGVLIIDPTECSIELLMAPSIPGVVVL